MQASTPIEPILVNLAGAAALCSVSESLIEKLVRNGQFPRPLQVSKGAVRFLRRDILAWAESLPVTESFNGQQS